MDEDIKAEPVDEERLAMFTSYNMLPDNISVNETGKHNPGLKDSILAKDSLFFAPLGPTCKGKSLIRSLHFSLVQ